MKDAEDLSDLVTRISVIDHRQGGMGRVIDAWDCEVVLDYQDNAQTLKVFINDHA